MNPDQMTARMAAAGLIVCLTVGCETAPSDADSGSTPTPARSASPTPPASDKKDTGHHYFHTSEQPHAAEWSYAGDTSPAHWGNLSPDYALADTGKHQSPIDISSPAPAQLPHLLFNYHPSRIDLVYNGHTIEEIENRESLLTFDNQTFTLEQFHFHSPSEHTVDGRHFDMEMHLVHKSDDGRVAVIGVFIESGKSNPAYDSVWDYLPTSDNRERKSETSVNASVLLPENTRHYSYTGSFTTPPCTEDVSWILMASPVQLSKDQIEKFRAVIKNNNRPVQSLNGRVVQVSD